MKSDSRSYSLFIDAIVFALLIPACANVQVVEKIDDYAGSVERLRARLVENPRDAESMRDLGVLHFMVKRYDEATDFLQKALAITYNDGKAIFYLGMSLEGSGKEEEALDRYRQYVDVAETSPYRTLLEGRFEGLTREVLQKQVRSLLAQEATLTNNAAVRTAAVFPLTYQGSDPKYAPLGYGMSEMLTVDLGYVEALKLVERLRVEALLQEIKLGVSGAVDPTTAPRMGKLLSAERIIGGSLAVNEALDVRVDIAAVRAGTAERSETATESDALDNLFQLEKDLVFRLVKEMGISLTRDESEQIQRRPTGSLQAFLSYSMGLEREALGDFDGASSFYGQAIAIDPAFERASGRREKAEAMKIAGTKEKAMAVAEGIEPPPEKDLRGSNSLMTDRMNNLHMGIGSSFIPGPDSRKPTESMSGELLPEAPKPPQ